MPTHESHGSPQTAPLKPLPTLGLLLWSIGAVFFTAVLGGALGLTVGASLGNLVPGYYRAVFHNGTSPDFDPVAVGIGQGLTQGFALGAFVGIALVALFYWYRSRMVGGVKTR